MTASSHQQLALPWWDDAPTPDDVPDAMPSESENLKQATGQGAQTLSNQALPFQAGRDAPVASAPVAVVAPTGMAAFRHPHAAHEMRIGDVLVAFELKRLKRNSIGMVVGPDGLSVRAPRWAGWPEIEQALREKSRWVCAKLHEQREQRQRQEAAQIDWKEGATFPLLGEQVIIVLDPRISGGHLHQDAQALPGVARQTLHVGLPQSATAEQIRDTVNAWMQRKALEVFHTRVEHFAKQLQVNVRSVKLSHAKTRWGSATSDGSIRLHWRLVHFSEAIIDYVVAHELAHLREMNHSPRFWGVVASVLPEYDQARAHLRTAVIPD